MKDLPKKISAPAGYYDYSDEDDDYYEDDEPRDYAPEPTVRLLSLPEKLSATDIPSEENRRFQHEVNNATLTGDNNVSTNLSDSVIKSSSDPVGIARQVRHLHNRVKLLEEELQTLGNRQIFVLGLATAVAVTGCFKILYK